MFRIVTHSVFTACKSTMLIFILFAAFCRAEDFRFMFNDQIENILAQEAMNHGLECILFDICHYEVRLTIEVKNFLPNSLLKCFLGENRAY